MSQDYFITMLSQCWNSSFSWGVLWGGNGIRNQNLDAKCAHCYWGIFASWPFQWTDMHIHKHTYIHTYTCICVIYMHMCNIHIYIYECMHKHAYKHFMSSQWYLQFQSIPRGFFLAFPISNICMSLLPQWELCLQRLIHLFLYLILQHI